MHSKTRSPHRLLPTCAVLVLASLGTAQHFGNFKFAHGAVNVGGKLFLVAHHAEVGAELWTLDSEKKKLRLVKDIHPGSASSAIERIIRFQLLAVFVADDGEHGAELWRSDGTEEGTSMVKDIGTGAKGAGIDLETGSLVAGRTLYFFAQQAGGNSLWKTDGTSDGTRRVKTFAAAKVETKTKTKTATGPHSYRMTLLPRGIAVFQIRDSSGLRLWRTDGTPEGTTQLAGVLLGEGSGRFSRLADQVVFAGHTGGNWGVWSTDGTAVGTKRLHDTSDLPGPAPTAEERQLAKTYMRTYCATCHGPKGDGNGLAGAALNPQPRDWTGFEWQDSVTDQHILKVIRDGGQSERLSALMVATPMYRKNPGVLKALVEIVRGYRNKR